MNKTCFFRADQTLQNYLKISVGKDDCNHTKYETEQIEDTTFFRTSNAGALFLPRWKLECNGKKIGGRASKLMKATKTISPTVKTRATHIPQRGDSFIYVDTSGHNCG